jgi:hypothetical protein
MLPSKALLGGILGVAVASSGCSVLEGLGDYSECTALCDASTRPNDGHAPEAASPEEAGPDAQGDGGNDEASSDDGGPGPTDAGQDDGDGASDAGGPGNGDGASDAGGPGNGDGASDAGGPGNGGDAGDGGGAGPRCAAPTDIDGGLLVYYPLEGDTNDHSGNGNNGNATVGTDVMFGPGKVGQGATILSTGRGIAVSGSATLGAARTLCAWVNTAPNTSGGGLPVFVVGSTGAGDLYDVATVNPMDNCGSQNQNALFIDHWGGPCARSSLAPSPGAWSFVCFAQSASSTTFFLNGGTFSASASTFSAALSTVTLGSDRIGGSTTQVVFKGQLDEISIWSAPLSTADMNAIYDGGSGCSVR